MRVRAALSGAERSCAARLAGVALSGLERLGARLRELRELHTAASMRAAGCWQACNADAGRLSSRHAALRASRLRWMGGRGEFKRVCAHVSLWTS